MPETFNGVGTPDSSAQLKIEEFFNDPLLTSLIHRAVVGNQELRVLAEDVQIASNEILARQGAYLPFISPGATIGLNKYSNFTTPGADIRDDPYLPGQFFPNPLPDWLLGFLFTWTPDIWWQLHNLKDAASMRYYAAAEARNAFVTRLVAEIADNYYRLMALDRRLEILDQTIALQQQSLEIARAKKEAARGTELAVQRFLAEVRRNQSEKLVINQDIIEAENRINFLVGRNPQHVLRKSGDFIDLQLHALHVGFPAQLLLNRPDIRQAERELAAAGLDVKAARKRFYPQGFINSGVGYEAFNPRYLFLTPESLVANVAGNMLVPLINRKAIKADYLSANARQLQSIYNYQRVVLTAFTEVINRLSKVENYRRSIELKKQQLEALIESVELASKLFQLARVDYVDVLFAQRDLRDARTVTVETKQQQLSAIVNTYQALGGGAYLLPVFVPQPLQPRRKWFSKEPQTNPMVATGGVPERAPPAVTGMGPVPVPPTATPPGAAPVRVSPTVISPEMRRLAVPASTAPTGSGPVPVPAPAVAPESALEPLPPLPPGRGGS